MVKTEYKCIISLNFTVIAANINPTPKEKKTIKISGTGTNNIVQCNSALVTIMTNIKAVNEAIKLIKLENTFDNTNKYLGTYTFLIKAALDTIDDIALVVASEKKLKITCPLIIYNGKFSISYLNRLENTTESTIIMHNGFNKVQRTPRTDLLYLIFISLATSSSSNGINFLKF